jgi:hypothetical protein
MIGSTIAVGIVVIGLLSSGILSTSGMQTWHDMVTTPSANDPTRSAPMP